MKKNLYQVRESKNQKYLKKNLDKKDLLEIQAPKNNKNNIKYKIKLRTIRKINPKIVYKFMGKRIRYRKNINLVTN